MNDRLEIKKVSKWSKWGGLCYDTHIPSEFTFEGSIEELRRGFDWRLLSRFRGPCADKYGSHDFFSTESKTKQVLESPHGFIVRVEENPGSGSWRDAVFEVTSSGTNEWEGRLLFYGAGSTGRSENHNKFLLLGLNDTSLEIAQFYLSQTRGASEIQKTVSVFKTVRSPSNNI